MIGFRAVVLSVCAHVAVAAGFVYYHFKKELPIPGDSLVIQAPLGQVFVKEAETPGAKPKEENIPESFPETAFPKEATQTGEDAPFANSESGTPNGEAQPIGKIEPVYPAASRKLGEEGEAVFLLGIDGDGFVTSATLENTSGFDRLDQAAREALLHARFHPAISQGIPVLSMKRFRIEFRLSAKSSK